MRVSAMEDTGVIGLRLAEALDAVGLGALAYQEI